MLDLSPTHLTMVTSILQQPMDFGLLGRLRDAFSESDLPIKVDVVDWSVTSAEFREIIKRNYEVVKYGNK